MVKATYEGVRSPHFPQSPNSRYVLVMPKLKCATCGSPCQAVYYRSLEEAKQSMRHGSICLGVNWGPGWRSLYFDLKDDVDFCSAKCSLDYSSR